MQNFITHLFVIILFAGKLHTQYYFYIAALCMGCSDSVLSGRSTRLSISTPIDDTTRVHTTRRSEHTLEQNLKKHITYLSENIGPRNISDPAHYQKLCQAAQYIDQAFQEIGYQTNITTYSATYRYQKFDVQNIEVVIPAGIPGSNAHNLSAESIVIGAHYDTVLVSPGADDNGSGIAVLIEIARHMYDLYRDLHDKTMIKRTIKLVAFPNEEWPYSVDAQTGSHFGGNMGSVQYAKQAKARGESITGMVALESIGYFDNQSNSQMYPWYLSWLEYFYGNQGNFLMMIGDLTSRSFQKQWLAAYQQIDASPMYRIALPGWLPNVYRSDHGAFALEGFPAFMITDTANFRNPHYHRATDKVATINFNQMTKVAKNLMETAAYFALDGAKI